MYENPELLLSAELQVILVKILCRKRTRTFTAKNLKQIDLVFCTCWLFPISFHHNFSHWNLLTLYKIIKETFFCYNMWERNSFLYVVGNIFFVSTDWLFMKMKNMMAATALITITLCRWKLNKLFSADFWKIFQKNLDIVLFQLLEKCISRCIKRQHVLHMQHSSYPRVGFTNFHPTQYSRSLGEIVLPPQLIFLSGTSGLPLNVSACLAKMNKPLHWYFTKVMVHFLIVLFNVAHEKKMG